MVTAPLAVSTARARAPAAAMIVLEDGKARCSCGGTARTKKLDGSADDPMSAETPRWREMGAGPNGPMRATMFGSLGFEQPKMEAMGNMGPFGGLLLLVGKVPGDWGVCP